MPTGAAEVENRSRIRGGYLAFLRAIDTRPSAADSNTVKARLGKKPRS